MDRKLLFFDIDGTLLAGGLPGYIPESAIESLKKAQENGHYLFINSGRTYDFMPKLIKDFPFDGYICGCGTHIIFHDEELQRHILSEDVKQNLIQILEETRIQGVFEGPKHCYYNEKIESFPPVTEMLEAYSAQITPNPIRFFSDPVLDFDKFVILMDENSNLPLFKERIADDFGYIERENLGSYSFAEIVPKNYSKASGIDFLVNYLNLSLDDCYVFGDSTNDLSMLEHVKHSIAMGNSFPEVLERTSYVTTPVDRDGIRNALKHFQLI